jgi:hypothetical protein
MLLSAELSSCDPTHVACNPELFTFKRNISNSWSRQLDEVVIKQNQQQQQKKVP